MKTFEFVAFGPSGRKEFGTIKAWRLAEAKKKIQEMGLYLASIKIQGEQDSHSKKSSSFFNGLKEFILL